MTNYSKNWTIERQRESNRASYHRNRDSRNSHTRDRQIQRRNIVINHYGGYCACCGESTLEFLAIDHIGGRKNHQMKNGTSTKTVDQIIGAGFPDGFRILCHNCNQATSWGRRCPHELLEANQ